MGGGGDIDVDTDGDVIRVGTGDDVISVVEGGGDIRVGTGGDVIDVDGGVGIDVRIVSATVVVGLSVGEAVTVCCFTRVLTSGGVVTLAVRAGCSVSPLCGDVMLALVIMSAGDVGGRVVRAVMIS